MAELTFVKNQHTATQRVYNGDKLIGSVRREEDWTVRGTRVMWSAWIKGRSVGRAETRKEAAKLLMK